MKHGHGNFPRPCPLLHPLWVRAPLCPHGQAHVVQSHIKERAQQSLDTLNLMASSYSYITRIIRTYCVHIIYLYCIKWIQHNCPFTHKGTSVFIPNLWLLQIKSLQTFVYKCFSGHMLSFHVGKHLGVALLVLMMSVCRWM